jgi:transcriptional regulator with XRE-family HTH domain
METIGDRIRLRRDQLGLTLPKLAEEAGVAKGYLWELENNKADRPGAQLLFKIATALGTTVADLLGEGVRTEGTTVAISQALAVFAKDQGLTSDEVEMLASVNYRGQRPKTKEDWGFLWESIRRSVRRRSSQVLRHANERRVWNSLEALALTKVVGIEDPVQAMKQQARRLIDKGELQGPPTDLRLLASIQDVLSVAAMPMREAGRLVPTSKGLLIQLNASDTARRQNFTTAHEIGHTLLPTYARHPVFRSEASVGTFPRNDEEEYLCDVAASSLVLPEAWLRPRASALGRSLRSIFDLAEKFQCSIEATALAWVQLGLWPCAVVVWEKMLKPTEIKLLHQGELPGLGADVPKPKFRVARFFGSPTFTQFLPKHKSVGEDSVIARAAAGVGSASGEITIELGGEVLLLECEAEFAPYKRQGMDIPRVVCLLSPPRRAGTTLCPVKVRVPGDENLDLRT